ncbi:MAG: SDR family oxidoreductase [Bacteroidetes bacterium]|nr:SDR family oxidoreductase [Bacteroidota bacterium]
MIGAEPRPKLLVTGGAGFIGSNLVEYFLSKQYHVVCLDNLSTGKLDNISSFLGLPHFTWIEGDIRDFSVCQAAVAGCDFVLHQAALGSVPRSISDPLQTNSVNISGFLNMLTASRDAGVKRFVYAASSSTYGDSQLLPKTEEIIGNPLSPYAVTKLVNELYADVFSKLYGMSVVGLRYFNVFGRRQDPEGAYAAVIPKFVNSFLQNKEIVINGNGEHSRDFTYIDNVILANVCALNAAESEVSGEVFNVAYGSQTSLNEMLQEMSLLFSKRFPEGSPSGVTYGPERVGDIPHSWASIEKAKKRMNYQPTHDFKKGLEEAIDWYIQNYSRGQIKMK